MMKKSLLCAMTMALFTLFSLPVFAAESTKPVATESPAAVEAKATTININTADAATLEMLHGVGRSRAAAIIAHRDANGSFDRVDQILEVKGIGPAILEKNRDRMTVE